MNAPLDLFNKALLSATAPHPHFPMTYCSQCGCELGAGAAGVSSCADHQRPSIDDDESTSLQPLGDGEALVRFDFEMARGQVTNFEIYGAVVRGIDVDADDFSPARIASWRKAIVRELESEWQDAKDSAAADRAFDREAA